jgi:uncharacterized protein (TIGR00299 family) protein
MNTAYLDCFSGASGDMLLGALIDAGMAEGELQNAINALNIPDCDLEISRVIENGLAATRVQVKVVDSQPARHLQNIEGIISSAGLEQPVREKVLEVFRCLADTEAAIHGCNANEVHFHEVGAVDALIDIVGVVNGFHHLGITQIFCSPLPVPRGWVNCAHGELPVPAPAVCRLLQGKPTYGVDLEQELVTPTGAALIHVLAGDFGPMPPMQLERTGYGAGKNKRRDGRPNLLRLMTGQTHQPDEVQQVEVIETALDDWNPETWPHVSDRLFHSGALDVILIPVQMKKGRPGFLLKIICEPKHAQTLKEVILSETTSIGLRFHTEQRMTLPREIITVQTKFGPMQAKMIITPTGPVITPEFEECRRVALEKNIPIKEVYSVVNRCSDASD